MSQIIELPRDVRSVNAMRSVINERALWNHSSEADRIRAVCEGVRLMVLGRSSAAAVALGKQLLGGRADNIHGYDGHAA